MSDLDTGLIHRLDASGCGDRQFRPRHGRACAARGSTRLPTTGRQIDIKDAAFDVEDPNTWGFTPAERRVSGHGHPAGPPLLRALQTRSGRSASVPMADFAGDARSSLQVANAPIDSAITKIAFDGEGRMYLAQRGATRGSYDYSVFAEPLRSSVLRYKREAPADPTLPYADWVPVAEQYAIGLPPDFRNASGGVALGYGTTRAAASVAARATARCGRPATTCATARPTRPSSSTRARSTCMACRATTCPWCDRRTSRPSAAISSTTTASSATARRPATSATSKSGSLATARTASVS